MTRSTTFGCLLLLNAIVAFGDAMAKRAVDGPVRNAPLTAGALALWAVACVMWLPLMRSRGFTALVALADAMGLVILTVIGYLFLGERLLRRETIGICLAIVAMIFLG